MSHIQREEVGERETNRKERHQLVASCRLPDWGWNLQPKMLAIWKMRDSRQRPYPGKMGDGCFRAHVCISVEAEVFYKEGGQQNREIKGKG